MMIGKIGGTVFRSALTAMLLAGVAQVPAKAQWSAEETRIATEFREETLARSIGTMAYIYAYPMVDYYRVMYEQTTPGKDPGGAYAPVNRFFSFRKLTVPGGPLAGRSANSDTLYFQAWVDLTNGPLVISAPDTNDRYYNLDYVDFYSETDAHTGRRTTGTAAQQTYLVGPNWKGTPPAGMNLVRLKTDLGYVLGRVLIKSDDELSRVNKLVDQFTIKEAEGTAPAPKAMPIPHESLYDMNFWSVANHFFKTVPVKPDERALVDQFEQLGIGPNSTFDPSKLSEARKRGLMQALADGRRVVEEGRMLNIRGWAPVKSRIGVYGTDYFARASVEYSGFLANMPEEAVYPRYRADAQGRPLDGGNRYRVIVPADMPVDAFWSLTAYSGKTRDLIPNEAGLYSVSDRDPRRLKRRADGSAEILIQAERPKDKSVNWLPVAPGGFYLLMRLYQPKTDIAFAPGYKLPDVERLD